MDYYIRKHLKNRRMQNQGKLFHIFNNPIGIYNVINKSIMSRKCQYMSYLMI